MYVIDAYRPVAGEITLAVMGFKCECTAGSLLFTRSDLFSLTRLVVFRSSVRLPLVVLHQHLGRAGRLRERFRRDGGDRNCRAGHVGAAVRLGEGDTTRVLEVADRFVRPLERGQGGRRVISFEGGGGGGLLLACGKSRGEDKLVCSYRRFGLESLTRTRIR